ncbi:hypothetical protein B0E47_14265 [Rhodanobacter sp. B05]|uniref:helix-turn-helix domain-containing protein n=1 Tax=Rhodanobacter sp. B05 TaxID=1945859 RepID=UPI0009D48C48|nr:hypothetical protein B0E47_14265 [Rhodanobacter sp. B05]
MVGGTSRSYGIGVRLAARVGITEANLSQLKQGCVKGVRFQTLEAICAVLDCQPGDLLEYRPDGTLPTR